MRVLVLETVLYCSLAFPSFASETARQEPTPRLPPTPRQVWVADDVRCPLDPEKPWGFGDKEPRLFSADGVVTEPKAIYHPSPQFADLEDTDPRIIPVVEAVINREGKVERIGVLKGSGPPVEAAVEAIKQWRFEPATLDGEPVCVVYIMIAYIQYR